jgi:hypothetical protein
MTAILGTAGLILSGSASLALANPSAVTTDNVTICHATRSLTHPYLKLTISRPVLNAHKEHGDRHDIVPAPAKGCPPNVAPVPYHGTFVPCVVGIGVAQTATTVTGTNADDTIDCTNASPRKRILGLAGNDTITGTALADTVIGGNGNDTVTGGPGIDYIEGNTGNDTLTGSAGADTVLGGSSSDTLSGGVGNDTLIGRPKDARADTVNGDANLDTCNGIRAEGDTLTGCEM